MDEPVDSWAPAITNAAAILLSVPAILAFWIAVPSTWRPHVPALDGLYSELDRASWSALLLSPFTSGAAIFWAIGNIKRRQGPWETAAMVLAMAACGATLVLWGFLLSFRG